jgi:hypothetical protein
MTDFQALALLLVLMGGFFVVLAIAPLAVFDRFEFWSNQAQWFRSNKIGSLVGRVLWGAFGLFLWVMAAVVLLKH